MQREERPRRAKPVRNMVLLTNMELMVKGQIRVLPGICVYEVDVCCGCVLRIAYPFRNESFPRGHASWFVVRIRVSHRRKNMIRRIGTGIM